MQASSPYTDTYLRYIQLHSPSLAPIALIKIQQILEATNWENPQTGSDWNNLAVVALVEAEAASDPAIRSAYSEMALEALQQGVEAGYPLCSIHLSLLFSLTGQLDQGLKTGFSRLVQVLHLIYGKQEKVNLGLVYLPRLQPKTTIPQDKDWENLFAVASGAEQAILLLGEALSHSLLVFYNSGVLHFLHFAAHLVPTSAAFQLKLGIASICNHQWEGLAYLHRAQELAPVAASGLQALHLAYRDLQNSEIAQFWHQKAQGQRPPDPDPLAWQWTQLAPDSPFTYVAFESLLLAVEPSLRSLVTTVLLAEGDWFEKEMEFWRQRIQAGMTVIDVGANVGVYAFSAAQRVGPSGRVIAVEPFSGCVRCLEETCKVNQLEWVRVCAGAASDRNGTARLGLHHASELNQIQTEETEPGAFEEVSCFTLDHLVEQEKLDRVDLLKIDAEGHEVPVLKGAEKLLQKFSPIVMYENIAGASGSNFPVAEFLTARGYQLCHYQPYVQELVPIHSLEELQGKLNIIALPPEIPAV